MWGYHSLLSQHVHLGVEIARHTSVSFVFHQLIRNAAASRFASVLELHFLCRKTSCLSVGSSADWRYPIIPLCCGWRGGDDDGPLLTKFEFIVWLFLHRLVWCNRQRHWQKTYFVLSAERTPKGNLHRHKTACNRERTWVRQIFSPCLFMRDPQYGYSK